MRNFVQTMTIAYKAGVKLGPDMWKFSNNLLK